MTAVVAVMAPVVAVMAPVVSAAVMEGAVVVMEGGGGGNGGVAVRGVVCGQAFQNGSPAPSTCHRQGLELRW